MSQVPSVKQEGELFKVRGLEYRTVPFNCNLKCCGRIRILKKVVLI